MSFFLTLIAAIVLILLSIILLGVGLILTGRSKLRVGMCGRTPEKNEGQNMDCEKKSGCSLCCKEKK